MNRLTPTGLVLVLGHVTLIMSAIVVATIVGIVLDRVLGTSPTFVLSGVVLGTAIAVGGLWLYIRAQQRGLRPPGADGGRR